LRNGLFYWKQQNLAIVTGINYTVHEIEMSLFPIGIPSVTSITKIVTLFLFLCSFHVLATAAEPANEWTALFDRTDGWIAGDGIFSFGMEGNSKQGSANEHTKTIFVFSDSLFGGVNSDGSYKRGLVMVNHAVAVLTGDKPDQAKMQFFHNTNDEGRVSNLFDRNYWLGDGIVIDSVLYTTGFVVDPKTWDMTGPWLIEVPILNEQLQFAETKTKPAALFDKQCVDEVLFGAGICDQGDDIYVYGVRDKKGVMFYRRQLVVAKAPRQTFGDISTWRFWSGKHWSESIAESNRDEAALAEAMSNELSVTKMIGGRYDGKFVLVYTEGCVGTKLNFAVADAPNAKFSELTTFYECPEPQLFDAEIKEKYGPKAVVYTYNAKAHPRLSKPGELLVSYNLNTMGLKEGSIFAEKLYGFPRFALLKLP